jgi:hypothetical protein
MEITMCVQFDIHNTPFWITMYIHTISLNCSKKKLISNKDNGKLTSLCDYMKSGRKMFFFGNGNFSIEYNLQSLFLRLNFRRILNILSKRRANEVRKQFILHLIDFFHTQSVVFVLIFIVEKMSFPFNYLNSSLKIVSVGGNSK